MQIFMIYKTRLQQQIQVKTGSIINIACISKGKYHNYVGIMA